MTSLASQKGTKDTPFTDDYNSLQGWSKSFIACFLGRGLSEKRSSEEVAAVSFFLSSYKAQWKVNLCKNKAVVESSSEIFWKGEETW